MPWKADGEGGAAPFGALDRDWRTVQLQIAPAQREPEPHPLKPAIGSGLLLRERLEQARQMTRRDARAGVADLDAEDAHGVAAEPDRDLAAAGEFDCVV